MRAAAQIRGAAHWEIEMHGGSSFAATAPGGAAIPLPAAETFVTGLAPTCPDCPLTQRVSSWFFGDGARLLNDVATARGLGVAIVPLDAVLAGSVAECPAGGMVGVRLGRDLGPRFGAEFTIDYGLAPLTMSSAAKTAIEASRASFVSAFTALTSAFRQPAVAATTDMTPGRTRRLTSTGAITITLRRGRRLAPYAVAGGGITTRIGTLPSATVEGSYRLTPIISAFEETDRIAVRAVTDKHAALGVIGGGLRWQASAHWGMRLDARQQFTRYRSATLVDAHPEIIGSASQSVVFFNTTPSIQFGHGPGLSSLSGPTLDGRETFVAHGILRETNISAGVYFRF